VAGVGRARVETLPSGEGTLRRLYRPEFRAADWLADALKPFVPQGNEIALVAPWVDEFRRRANVPPPGATLTWPTPEWNFHLDKWDAATRLELEPVRVPSGLLLHGPTADVEHLEAMLVRLDRPAPAVAVGITVAEVRCEGRSESGGHLLFSRDAAPESPDTFYRGTSADFEPESWLRARLTGVMPFQGTSVTFGRFEANDGLFEYVLRGLALRQEAEVLAQPCLVCTEEYACGLESVVQVPARTLVAGIPVPTIEIRPLDAGVRLGLRAVRIGTDSAVLDLRVELRTAEPRPEADAIPGSFVVRRRELATRVTVRDGESVVLGGLRLTRRLCDRRNEPLFSSVPVLDTLVSGRGAEIRRTELLFVLSPRLMAVGQPAAPCTPCGGDTRGKPGEGAPGPPPPETGGRGSGAPPPETGVALRPGTARAFR
jgi:hypothetical protein